MMAAGRAAQCGAAVLLLEKTGRLGNKLRITGKGRCNVTNQAELREFITHFGPQGRFLYRAFSRFFHEDLRAFLQQRGVPTVIERGGRVFPYSNEAEDVVRALTAYLTEGRVEIRYRAPARRLLIEEGRVAGVELEDGSALPARAVILATGGLSYPLTGSSGDGYRMAEEVGHRLVPQRPALVPLVTKEPWVASLQGLALRNVRASLLVSEEVRAQQFGEMLFTHFGLSGPIILTLSKAAVTALGQGRVQISIDLKPALTDEQLDARLRRDLDEVGKKTFRNILKGLVPLRMRDLYVTLIGIPADKPGHQITAAERQRLMSGLRDLRLTVIGARPIEEAIITAGGVDLSEVEPRTMESRRVRGLYFCGEVLDLDADTGGYNLQAAFSTGYLAGECAAEPGASA